MDESSVDILRSTALTIRNDIIDMCYSAQSGHPGGSLSAVEILTVLYFYVMDIDPAKPQWKERDRFILSKGHASPVLYSTLARRGYFQPEELFTFRQLGSRLQGHPSMIKTQGVDFSTGSLGQGLSVALGMALAARIEGLKSHYYVLLGDGEINEGQVWEAAMASSKFKVRNLTAILDSNGVQLDGTTRQIMPLGDIEAMWSSFGWTVIKADGHDITDLLRAFEESRIIEGPTIIIACTVKGKGVSFMEGKNQWHGGIINNAHYAQAKTELEGVCI